MLKLLMLFVLLILSKELLAQYPSCYYLKLSNAKVSFFEKNYPSSVVLYEQAFKIQANAFPHDFLGAAKANSAIGDFAKSAKYLTLALQGGLLWEQVIPDDSVWTGFKKSKYWHKIQANYKTCIAESQKKIDIAAFELFAGIHASDQLIRKSHVGLDTFFNANIDTLFYNTTDSLNFLALRRWIDKHGFPTYPSIPYYFRIDLITTIVHAFKKNNIYWGYYQPILKTALTNGNITPQEYAMIIDIYYLDRHKTGYYNLPGRSKKRATLYNVSKVDEYRREIGLESLEDYAKMRNITLPDDYPKPPVDYYNLKCD